MQLEVGSILEGKVTGITKFGIFVDLGENNVGMVHISEVASTFVKEIRDFVTVGQMVKVKILDINSDGKISLSMKQAAATTTNNHKTHQNSASALKNNARPGNYVWKSKPEPTSFEDMMSKFKQTSDEKMSALKKGAQSKRGGNGYSRRGAGNSHR